MTSNTAKPARLASVAGCLIMVGFGTWWMIAPAQLPFTGLARLPVSALLPDQLVGLPLIIIGLVGAMLIVLLPRIPIPAGQVVAGLIGVVLFVGYQGPTLSMLGYATASSIPILVIVGLVVVMIKVPRLRVPLALVVAALVGLGLVAGYAAPSAWLGFLSFASNMIQSPLPIVAVLMLAANCAWLWLTVAIDPAPFAGALRLITRYRKPITIAAAACFAPYTTVRLLWLVGIHPEAALGLGGPNAPKELDIGTRLWGGSLGIACALGGLAVIGLICRWGEVFPRWFPVIGGRRVPIPAAVVPGGLVGIAFLSALPKSVTDFVVEFPESLKTFWAMPFGIWGPLLILAVAGYLGHRLGVNRRAEAAQPL